MLDAVEALEPRRIAVVVGPDDDEIVKDSRQRPVVHKRGTYLFRLAGRDREKSASYYTPEVLTACLTKYTLKERLGEVRKRRFLLTWTWHPRPLNTAVANSALLIASKFGMDVTLLCPEEAYRLDSQFEDAARQYAEDSGGSLRLTHDIADGYTGADVVYAKSWGALPYYGRPEEEWELRRKYRHFIVDEEKMALTNDGVFSHCLPLRRAITAYWPILPWITRVSSQTVGTWSKNSSSGSLPIPPRWPPAPTVPATLTTGSTRIRWMVVRAPV